MSHGGPAPEEDEHIEIVPWPLSDLDGAIAATTDAKTLIGAALARARTASAAEPRPGQRRPSQQE